MSTSKQNYAPSKVSRLVDRFAASKIPAVLAYGLAAMSAALGLAFVALDPVALRGNEYGVLFQVVPLDTIGVVLTVASAALAGMHRYDPGLSIFPAGVLAVLYSVMAGCVSLAPGGIPAAPDLFVLLLFAGYVAGVVSLTSGADAR